MSQDRIILGFDQRLALENQVRALGDATSAFELEQRARELASHGNRVLNAFIRQLETDNAQLRGGLGLTAQHMDPMLIIPTLRQVVADTRRSDDARLTAAMILQRYLSVDLDPALAQTLPGSREVARKSAEEALQLAVDDPMVLVEYTDQLLEEPEDVIHTVIDVLTDMEDPERANLLRVIASYVEPHLVARILPALGTIRHPHALQALLVLNHLTEPALKPLVERQVRKLHLTGVRPDDAIPLRMLWSPVNAQGQSLLQVICYHPQEAKADFLALVLHDKLGLIHAEYRIQVETSDLPAPAPPGHVHSIHMTGSHYVLRMLELDPDLGRELLDDAVERLQGQDLPWPGELVVFGHWFWRDTIHKREKTNSPSLPKPASSGGNDDFHDLLKHRAFASWAWDLPHIHHILQNQDMISTLEKGSDEHQAVIQHLIKSEADDLAQRLQQQACWLTLAHELDKASLVLAAREAVLNAQADHPFVQALAWRSLLTAVAEQATQRTLRLLPREKA